uniref:Acyl-CoA-binding domain-containing protein 5 n=1 Tax=Geotrypetes seraphini TaxID=260995 RepID=A0A6P8PF85_GEOSA|nr:acyl-CoA-binding domain-containing protein 4 isoform X3 [Geotrypetes seraphini]
MRDGRVGTHENSVGATSLAANAVSLRPTSSFLRERARRLSFSGGPAFLRRYFLFPVLGNGQLERKSGRTVERPRLLLTGVSMDKEETNHQRQFQAAVSVIQSLPKNGSYRPSYEEMRRFYSYYKQATVGCCNIPRPGFWDPIGRYKWDAWNGLGTMTKGEAMAAYITEMKRIAQKVIDTIPVGETSVEMFKYFEPLYEVIQDMPRPPESFFQKKAGKGDHLQGKYIRSEEGRNRHVVIQTEEAEQDIKPKITVPDALMPKTTGLGEKEQERDAEAVLSGYSGEWVCTPKLKEKLQKEAEEALISISQVSTPTLENRYGEGTEYSQVTSDSESEVFCDSLDQLELSQNQLLTDSYSSQCSAQNGPQYEVESWEGSYIKLRARKDRLVEEEWSPHNEMGDGFLHPVNVRARTSRPEERQIGKDISPSEEEKGQPELTAQVTAAVRMLQNDLSDISIRLFHLEALTASQAQLVDGGSLQLHDPSTKKATSWWPPKASYHAFIFLLLWPFFVHWLMKKFQRHKR